MKHLNLTVNDEIYTIVPREEPDPVSYEVYISDQLQCAIAVKENGEWEADRDFDELTVKEIGCAIEDESYTEAEFDVEGEAHPADLDTP